MVAVEVCAVNALLRVTLRALSCARHGCIITRAARVISGIESVEGIAAKIDQKSNENHKIS